VVPDHREQVAHRLGVLAVQADADQFLDVLLRRQVDVPDVAAGCG
jgi:hypothetical protein